MKVSPGFEPRPGNGGRNPVSDFYRKEAVRNLPAFVDSAGQAAEQVGTVGRSTTLLTGRNVRGNGRTLGPANWSGAEVVALICRRIGAPVKERGND